jgi:hypothetical protein
VSAKTAEKERIRKLNELLWFCAKCFASNENGSWGGGIDVAQDEKRTNCSNCGAWGCAVKIPRWAVESIREQASWVGKRYYPIDEDKARYAEIQALRALVTEFPGRSAEKIPEDHPDDVDQWWVHQELPHGGSTSTSVKAKSAEEALKKGRLLLPYIPKNALKNGK